MSTITTPTTYTPEDLLRMPDGDRYELVDGHLVERTVSTLACYVAGRLYHLLITHCDKTGLGWAFTEGNSYCCFPDAPNRVRRADVSFIRRERFSPEQVMEEGHTPVAPDLVVEVISPNDLAYEVDEKVGEWLAAGVRLLWVINPRTRQVRIERANGSYGKVGVHEELSGEDVVPDFHCPVANLFQLLPEPKPDLENR